MLTLRALQDEFRDYILRPAGQMTPHVVGTERVDTATRLAIYADGYRLRLAEALDANYPALHRWIGGEGFAPLARAYLDAYPSQHYSIRWFGRHLPQFMARTLPWSEQALALELARFEWAMSEAFDVEDALSLNTGDFASIAAEDWPRLRFHFHPSLRMLTLNWNVPDLWRALTKELDVPAPQASEHPLTWIVWRQALTLYFRRLEVDEAWALGAAVSGRNFAELCEGLCEWIDAEHVAARAAGFLRQWTESELITRAESG